MDAETWKFVTSVAKYLICGGITAGTVLVLERQYRPIFQQRLSKDNVKGSLPLGGSFELSSSSAEVASNLTRSLVETQAASEAKIKAPPTSTGVGSTSRENGELEQALARHVAEQVAELPHTKKRILDELNSAQVVAASVKKVQSPSVRALLSGSRVLWLGQGDNDIESALQGLRQALREVGIQVDKYDDTKQAGAALATGNYACIATTLGPSPDFENQLNRVKAAWGAERKPDVVYLQLGDDEDPLFDKLFHKTMTKVFTDSISFFRMTASYDPVDMFEEIVDQILEERV